MLACGALFDGRVDAAGGPAEVLVDDDRIVEVGESVGRPAGAEPADGATQVLARVRTGHKYGSDWIKTANAGGYYSPGDDPARVTWFDEEMTALVETATQQGLPVAVHTSATQACKQAIRVGVRSLEQAYPIGDGAVTMAEQAGTFVPTQMIQEDLDQLRLGTLPERAVGKFHRDHEQIQQAQRRIAASTVKIAYGTDCGMFLFSHGITEFQAMVAAGLPLVRTLQAAASVAVELLGRDDLGVVEAGGCADLVGRPGDPTTDITATARVGFVMAGRVHRRQGAMAPDPKDPSP
jgi:imidazolonepropionase-like amidohydrolase